VTASNRSVRRDPPARLATVRAKIQAAHRGTLSTQLPEPKCYTVSHSSTRGQPLAFHDFDESYMQRLREGDFPTTEHFSGYFTRLLQLKLRGKLRSPQDIEDTRQETLARVLLALKDDKIRQPDRLGAFVFGTCQRVLQEGKRVRDRDVPWEDGVGYDFPDTRIDIYRTYAAKQTKDIVRNILNQMGEKDRCLLRAIFLEERDKDEVCQEFGVTRENLRVLLFRARRSFRSFYTEGKGESPKKRANG
jgi:RNA polymerase sigma-70 factor (ECF subfamily)